MRVADWRRPGLAVLAIWCAVIVGVGAAQVSQAPQVPAPVASPQAPPTPNVPVLPNDATFPRIRLLAGRSQVLSLNFDVTRLAITNPAVADATRIGATEILVDAKAPGITSLILWQGDSRRLQYDIVVDNGVLPLQAQMATIYPSEDIHVSVTDDVIVLSGHTSTNEIALKAAEIAQASSSKAKVINLLEGIKGIESQQVMLEVRFAEVAHTTLMEVGASFLANRPGFQGGTTTQQFQGPNINEASQGQLGAGTVGVPAGADQVIQVPNFLNLFFFLRRDGLLALLRALQSRGKFQSLAEPNLIAYNGQEASFLAGGEFPVPIVQGNTGQVTIQFKEFGVRLKFRPTILGETIRLKVEPEVSTLDFANGLSLAGFRVPALKTRRAETEVVLRDGQSFAIAGLLDNQSVEDRQAIPLLSKLPIIGALFKSRADNAERTELLVLITPHLVRPLEPSEVPPLPIDPKRFISPESGPGPLLHGGGGLVDGPSPDAVKEKP